MNVRVGLVVVCLGLLAGPASAIDVTASVTHSDVGLYDSRGGASLGVAQDVLASPGPVDLRVGVEYVQRRGAQPRYFSSTQDGLILDNAEVTLHYLQTAAFVGAKFPMSGFIPRLYGGVSFALKVGETWDQPEGATNGEIGYEDTDVLAHLGLTVEFTRYFFDARYSLGLTRQVVDNTDAAVNKMAEVQEEGLDGFEDGNKVSGFQVGLGMRF